MHELKEEKIKKLYESYPILLKLNNNSKIAIEKDMIFKNLKSEQFLSNKLDQCEGFLFVLSGIIKIERLNENGDETNLYNVGKGEICHEMLSCFVTSESLSVLGRAIVDSEIAILPFHIFKEYLLNDAGFFEYMYIDLYRKLKNIIDKKEEIIHLSVDKRLEKLLNSKGGIIYMTHNEIAMEIGTSREVVSRKLKNLEKQGFLKLKRGKIQINNQN